MSDDISIPQISTAQSGPVRTAYTHSYRSRNTSALDGGTKRLAIAAGALLLLLVLAFLAWTLGDHRSHGDGVPTIAADTSPMRVKPEATGAAAVPSGLDPGSTVVAPGDTELAPLPERPDANALAGRPAPVPTQAPADAAPKPAAAPQPAAAAQAPARPAPAAKEAVKPVTGKVMVQLAAVGSEKGAQAEWERLTHKMPELLRDRALSVQKTEQGGRAFWRVRTGGFSDMADAAEFCKKVKAQGAGCSLATF